MLLAVASGVVIYAYVMGWLGGATENTGSVQYGQIQIDSLWHNTTAIILTIRNVGQKALTPEKVYIDGLLTTPASGSFAQLSPSSASSEIILTHSLSVGQWCEVKVTCTDGTIAAQAVQAKN